MVEKLSSISFVELMRDGMTIADIQDAIATAFEKKHGSEKLAELKASLAKSEIVNGVYYADIISKDYFWYALKVIERAEVEKNCKLDYLLRMEEPELCYRYKGIRAIVIKLFYTCGGSMSILRDVWDSQKGGEPKKSPKELVLEESAPTQPTCNIFGKRD